MPPLEEINRCIAEYEGYNFIFSNDFLEEVRNGCNTWKNDWVVSFKKQLRRIKSGEGTLTHEEENEKRVTTPLVQNRYMAITFQPQDNGSFSVYGFKLETRKK